MIILDTNIISETMRLKPDQRVVEWLDSQTPNEVHLCAPVLAELYYGVARLADPERRTVLSNRCRDMVRLVFDGRILPFDVPSAEAYGNLVTNREMIGRPISVMDAMIGAIAKTNRATLATRNTRDFEETGVTVINPFDS